MLIFSSNRCPTAKAYAERMNALQRDYGPRGVQLVAINSNDPHLYPDESYPRMVERAAEDGYAFPYLVDEGQRVAGPTARRARSTSSSSTASAASATRAGSTTRGCRRGSRSHDLRNALDDLLAGREVRRADDPAVRLQPRLRLSGHVAAPGACLRAPSRRPRQRRGSAAVQRPAQSSPSRR